jgi:hypothetical protein
MADIKIKYGTTNQAITCTLNSLANASARASTVVDNTTNLFLDALVEVTLVGAAASVSAAGYAVVWAYATADGTTYSEGATGTDAAITLTVPPNAVRLDTISVVANNGTYKKVFSIARAFGGSMPAKWGVIVENQSGAAFAAAGNSVVYQGILGQTV